MTPPTARLLVVDLDDTLWRWFDPWFKSFRALLDEFIRLSDVGEDELVRAIRPIHQERGTSEYSWLIDDLTILDDAIPAGQTKGDYYDPALHAQNSARKAATVLYPKVMETLLSVRAAGTKIVAYTESLEFWTRWRIKLTGLAGVIDVLYTSPDHDAPAGVDVDSRRSLPEEDYRLVHTVHRHVPPGVLKPDPQILTEIIRDQSVAASETAYVGDSLMKDVVMAQSVEAIDVWAKYGASNGDPRYSLLQAVSHWPDVAVETEQRIKPGVEVTPRFTLVKDFGELLDKIAFEPT